MAWLAVQDGSGPWKKFSGTTLTVNDSAGRYGVAWVCTPSSGEPIVELLQATVADSSAVSASCQQPVYASYDRYVSGTLSGIPSGGSGFVAIADHYQSVTASNPAFTMIGASPGSQTLVAYGLDSGGAGTKIVVQRGVGFGTGTTTHNVNLASGTAFTVDSMDVTNMPSGETPLAFAQLASAGTRPAYLGRDSKAHIVFAEIPSSLLQGGDIYDLTGMAVGYTANSTGAFMQRLFKATASPGVTTTLPLPPVMSSNAGVGVVGGTATVNWGKVTFANGGGLTAFVASVMPSSGTPPIWRATVTKGWLGTGTSYVLPDLSSTTGWNASWNFPTNEAGTAEEDAWHVNVDLPRLQELVIKNDFSTLPDGTVLEQTMATLQGTY